MMGPRSAAKKEVQKLRKGRIILSLGQTCDGLIGGASALQVHLKSTVNDTLFDQKTSTSEGGFVRRAFSGISEYSHSRRGIRMVIYGRAMGQYMSMPRSII
jgi:hypothetical protein